MRRLLIPLLCALVLGACAAEQPAATPEGPASPTGEPAVTPEDPAADAPEEPAVEAPAPASEALDFSAPLLGGGTFDGGDYDGRDVALWFWAPW